MGQLLGQTNFRGDTEEAGPAFLGGFQLGAISHKLRQGVRGNPPVSPCINLVGFPELLGLLWL